MTTPPDSAASFLYPFLQNEGTVNQDEVLAEVRESTVQKCQEVVKLRQMFIQTQAQTLVITAQAMAAAFVDGKKLLVFGNGGSATDAADMAADFMNPPSGRPALPALALTNDVAVITGVGNDVGFNNIFARQVIALAEVGDIAIGLSTSGASGSVLDALVQAKKMGLFTIGIAGYNGGQMVDAGLDACLTVSSTYVPRIQEVQATVYHTLWALVHEILESSG